MKQFVFYTHSMYTGFGNVGFIHANLIQKNYLQKITVGTFFQKQQKNIYMLEAPAIMEVLKKRLNTVLYK